MHASWYDLSAINPGSADTDNGAGSLKTIEIRDV